jgi:hypothetical protein
MQRFGMSRGIEDSSHQEFEADASTAVSKSNSNILKSLKPVYQFLEGFI